MRISEAKSGELSAMSATIELHLKQVEHSHRALALLTWGGKQASHEFDLPWLSPEERKIVYWALELYRQDQATWPGSETTRSGEGLGLFVAGRPADDRLQTIGRHLYQRVFGTEAMRALLDESLHAHSPGDAFPPAIHIRSVAEDSQLQMYPWELLHDSHGFLFNPPRAALVRTLALRDPLPVIELSSALRVLVVSPRPDDIAQHGLSDLSELDRAENSDRRFLERVSGKYADALLLIPPAKNAATLDAIDQRLFQPGRQIHVVHIDTHGAFGWLCSNEKCLRLNSLGRTMCSVCGRARENDQQTQGYLAFEDQARHLSWVDGHQLGRILFNRRISLVVLSACKSGLISGDSVFFSVAGALIENGIPAVVGMQYSIGVSTAARFVDKYYEHLIKGIPAVDALAEARRGLSSLSRFGAADDAWYRPVLYVRTDPTNSRCQLFTRRTQSAPIGSGPVRDKVELEFPYGTMLPNSRYYIQRKADLECLSTLMAGPSTICLLGPRQTGKSSLIVRLARELQDTAQIPTAYIDLQQFIAEQLKDSGAFCREFCRALSRAVYLEDSVADFWARPDNLPASDIARCRWYITDHILPNLDGRLLMALDGLERLLGSSFSEDFFRMFRVFHDERAMRPLMGKLSFLLSVSTDPRYLINDRQGSPFNVAQHIRVEHFTREQLRQLTELYGLTLSPEQLDRLFTSLGGHPFLTRLALHKIAEGTLELEQLLIIASDEAGPFGDHLRRIWQAVHEQPDLERYLRDLCLSFNEPTWKKVGRQLRFLGAHGQGNYDRGRAQTRLLDAGIIEVLKDQPVFANIVYQDFFCSVFKNSIGHA